MAPGALTLRDIDNLIRQAYASFRFDAFDEVGKKFVHWGKVDFLSPLDVPALGDLLEGPLAARVNERRGRHIGDQVAVEIAESNQIAYQSGAYLLRRTLTVFDRSLPLAESNQAFLVAA